MSNVKLAHYARFTLIVAGLVWTILRFYVMGIPRLFAMVLLTVFVSYHQMFVVCLICDVVLLLLYKFLDIRHNSSWYVLLFELSDSTTSFQFD